MTTKEAFEYILANDKDANKYRLSKALKVSHTTIANYVNGKHEINENTYKRLIEIYPKINIEDVSKDRTNYTLGL